jgi:hypothetical protein
LLWSPYRIAAYGQRWRSGWGNGAISHGGQDAPSFGVALTSPTSVSQFRSEFDAFLYASVEDRSDGPLLSVLSALARLDIDPWQEAATLTRMSRDKAVWRMAALIETLPGEPSAHLNAKTIATRLVALLPRQIVVSVGSRGTTSIRGNSANIRFIMALLLLNAVFMAFSFGRHYFGGAPPPATPANNVHSSVIGKIDPTASASHVGK